MYGENYTEKQYYDADEIKKIMSYLVDRPEHSGWQSSSKYSDTISIQINLTGEYIKTYNSFSLYAYVLNEDVGKLCTELGLPQ